MHDQEIVVMNSYLYLNTVDIKSFTGYAMTPDARVMSLMIIKLI